MRLGNKLAMRIRLAVAISAGLLLAATQLARADADGPDFYRVTGVASNDMLNMRAEPSGSAGKVGEIPHNANGVKNLGCRGGLSLAQWLKASPSQRDTATKNRWCRVTFKGITGWVAGRFLAEGAAPFSAVAIEAPEGVVYCGGGKIKRQIEYLILKAPKDRWNVRLVINGKAKRAMTAYSFFGKTKPPKGFVVALLGEDRSELLIFRDGRKDWLEFGDYTYRKCN